MHLDPRTVVVLIVVGTTATSMGLSALAWGELRQVNGISRWARATGFQALGWLLTGVLRGVVPDAVSVIVGNGLIQAALCEYLIVIADFTGAPDRRRWAYTLLGAELTLMSLFWAVYPEVPVRGTIQSICAALATLPSAWILLTVRRPRPATYTFTGGVFALCTGLLTIRAVAAFAPGGPGSVLSTSTLIEVTYLGFFLVGVLVTFGFAVMSCDRAVAEWRRAERASESARDASRAKSIFLATMSHEIRTPMNAVLGFADLLLDTPLNDEQRAFASTIRRSGESLTCIIDDVLDFSKIEAGKLTVEPISVDAATVLREVVELMSVPARAKHLSLVVDYPPAVSRLVAADPERFRQVLLNYVSNAVKFTADGVVTLRGRDVTTIGQRSVRFEVIDSGPGIPADKLATLFEPFEQADSSTTRRFGGTGLGLAINKRLVEMMGGRVGVESRVGEGATFWFTLPAPDASAVAASCDVPTKALAPPVVSTDVDDSSLRGLSVLVAEDGDANQLLLQRLLTKFGCDHVIVANGRDAVERFSAGRFDMILMDCFMPDMDGYEATEAIRALERVEGRARVPIIAVTASVVTEDLQRCLQSGMDDCCPKPVRAASLRAVMERWRAQRTERAERPPALVGS